MRKIQTVVTDSVENQILKLVDYPKQVLTKRCHVPDGEEAIKPRSEKI